MGKKTGARQRHLPEPLHRQSRRRAYDDPPARSTHPTFCRRCRALEICPAFVDVALRRWERATGKEAVLDGTDRSFAEVAVERDRS